MANLYYNGAVDSAWDELGNWWNDAVFSDPALALPADGDDVYLAAGMFSGPSVSVTLNHIYVADASTGGENLNVNLSGAIGDATFNNNSYNFFGTVTGNATFNGGSSNQGIVAGNATFNDNSLNGNYYNHRYYNGTVTGNATFNDYSYNYLSTVTGDATFNGFSSNFVSTVTGDATFNGNSSNYQGTVTGNATFNDYSVNNGGIVTGDATFNGNSNNGGTVSGDATFNDSSVNNGIVTGNATFNYLTATNGVVTDTTGYANGNVGGVTKDSLGATITDWVFDTTNNNGTVTGDATFNGNSSNYSGTVTGNATFNYLTAIDGVVIDVTSYANGNVGGTTKDSIGATITDWVFDTTNNNGTVTGNATFNGGSVNAGTVTGNATFHNASRNSGTVTGNAFVYYDGGDGQKPIGGTVSGTVTYIGFPPPLTIGCEAYWNLNDDGSGGVSLVDSTGNGYALTNNGSVALGTGKIGGCGVFGGAGQYLTTSTALPIAATGEQTISFWLNYTADTTLQVAYSGQIDSSNQFFDNGDGTIYFGFGGLYTSAPSLGTGWNHVVGVGDEYGVKLYVNGSLASSLAGLPTPPDLDLMLGNQLSNGPYPLNGSIDEIGVWNRALSSTEVAELYSNGSGNTYPFPQTATSTLYYNNSQEDGDWGNILNWWQDSAFTFPATALPTSTNPVNLYGSVTQNTQGADQCFCHDASFWSADFGVGLTIVSTGIVNVHGSSVFDGYTEDGISMHDSTIIGPDGVIATNAVLRDGATNQGTIIGNAEVHYDGGNGVFPIGGTVGGSVTYVGWPAVTPQWFNDDPSVGGGNDGDFSNLLNWWTDSNYNVRPLNAEGTQELPDVSTDVFIAHYRGFYANTGAINPTVNSISATNNGYIASISITVSNGVQFSGDDYYGCYLATIYGNVTFSGTAYNDSSMILGNADYKSAVSLVTSFYYNSLQRILSGGVYGSNTMTVSIPTGGDQMIARLLNLPWFINL